MSSITITTDEQELDLDAEGPQVAVSVEEQEISISTTGPQVAVAAEDKELTVSAAGPQVAVAATANRLTVGTPTTGIGTMTNVGGAAGEVYRDKVGDTFNLRTLAGINNIGVAVNGNKIDIDGTALSPLAIAQTVKVAKSGAQFTGIQAGIDSITDAASDKPYTVLIYDGEYNENIVLTPYISLVGVGKPVIWSNTGTVLTMATSGVATISNIKLKSTPTAPGAKLVYSAGAAFYTASHVDFEYLPTGTYGIAIDMQLGSLQFDNVNGTYTQTGAGGGDHIMINTGAFGGAVGAIGTLTMNVAADDDIYGYKTAFALSIPVNVGITQFYITASHATYSSNVYGIYHAGAADQVYFTASFMRLTATGGTVTGDGTAIYIDNGAAQIDGVGNNITVSGFANNYQANVVQAGDTLLSHFDKADTADGVIGAGTYAYINTNEAGDLQISGSYRNMYDAVKTIGPRADYQVIQTALDDNAVENILFLVQPGTYTYDGSTANTINFTANNQTVMGASADMHRQLVTTTNQGTICDCDGFTGCYLANMVLEITAGTTLIHNIDCDGELEVYRCNLHHTTTYGSGGTQPSCIYGSGTIVAKNTCFDLNHTGSNTSVKAAVWLLAGADFTLDHCDVDVDCANGIFVTTTVFGELGTTFQITHSTIDVKDTTVGAVAGVYLDPSTTGDWITEVCRYRVEVGTGIAYGIYNNGGSGSNIKSLHNHYECVDTGGTAQAFHIAPNASTTTIYDTTDVTDPNTGTGTFIYCSSFAEGDFSLSGTLTVGDGGSGDSVVNLKTNDSLRALFGIDDSDSDLTKLSGPSGFGNDDWAVWNTAGSQVLKGAHSSGQTTVTAVGPTDDLDVSAVNSVLIDTSSNNVTIGGFTGGVAGQILTIAVVDATNNAILEHNEGTGNQDIFLNAGGDDTITAS
ncbi:MAG: hypothetical protein ACXADY_25225, partial [Candidatus Hodarchaeales archaeon]